MSAQLLARLWLDGGGPDDRAPIAAALPSALDDEVVGLMLWADWVAAEDGSGSGVDPNLAGHLIASDPISGLVVAAIELRAAITRRDHPAIDRTLIELDRAIALTPHGDRGATAHAAADLALVEAALYTHDHPTAERVLANLLATGPTALRITAHMRAATLALANGEPRDGQKRARQALTLARTTNRPLHGASAQLLLGLCSYAAEDLAAMRGAIEPLVAARPDDAFARMLLASLEGGERALELISDGLGRAATAGDAMAYTLLTLAGARAYIAHDRRADALIVVAAARLQLRTAAPELAGLLDRELAGWRRSWGEPVFAEIERAAGALLDR